MKRILCMLAALVMLLSLGMQAFADEVLYCRICGKKIPADSKVCQYCGKEVVHPDQSAAAASPAPSASAAPSASPTPTAEAAPAVVSPAPAETLMTPAAAAPSVAVKTSPTTAVVPGPFYTTLGSVSAPRRVQVTKSPTSESVPYGGSCCFIAHAVNATTITWYIASADSSVITTVSDAARKVSGLYVSGANADTLYLSGIPSWMNGCQVQARFDGEGGPVYTDVARIWTYQPAKDNSWCWWDWFKYYYECDPYYWDYPWYWYNYWCLNPGSAPIWFHPDRPDPPPKPKPVHPDPPPEPKPVHPDPVPQTPTYVIEYWIEDNNTSGSTAILTTTDRDDVIKVEKDDRSAWDQDILELVMDHNFNAEASGNTGSGNTLSASDNTGNSSASENPPIPSDDTEEGVMQSEWDDSLFN